MMKQGRGDGTDRPAGLGGGGVGSLAGPTLPSGKPIPTGPDMQPMSGSDDGGVPLHHPTDPLPPSHSPTAPSGSGPTTVDYGVNTNANTQDQVNSIYGAPTLVNPPLAAASPAATGLAGMQRPLSGKALRLNTEGLR